jgi:hypothetical protein
VAHTLPPRRFRDGEPVDPEPFNQVYQETATKLASRLNEHDLNAGTLKADVAVADGAYYAAHLVRKEVSPDLTRGGGLFYANADNTVVDDVAELATQGQWQSLADQNDSTAKTSVSITSGDDILVVIAQAQHFAWYGTGSTFNEAATPSWNTALRIQYALKVDDVLLDNTVTGAFFFPDAPPQEWYRATPTASSADFDYRHIQYVQDTVGTNNALMPVSLFYAVPVASGTHDVELVARMLPGIDYKTPEDGDGVTVQVFNRQLFVLRIRGESAYTGGAPGTVVSAFDDGTNFTLANLFTNGQYALRDTLNDIEPKHVERGALRNEHLPSLVYGPTTKILTDTSATSTIDSLYPGYGVDGAGWTLVSGALGNLEVFGPVVGPATEWDLETYPGLFVVLANVQVPYLKWKVGWGGSRVDTRALGILVIATTDRAGTRTIHRVSEAYVNAHNRDPYDTTEMHDINVDIPLMLVLDSDDLAAGDASHIEKVEVLASTWNAVDGTEPFIDLKCQRAGLCAFVLKGVHLS